MYNTPPVRATQGKRGRGKGGTWGKEKKRGKILSSFTSFFPFLLREGGKGDRKLFIFTFLQSWPQQGKGKLKEKKKERGLVRLNCRFFLSTTI